MEKFIEYIEKNQDVFVKVLSDAVAIPSVSAQLCHRKDVYKMAEFIRSLLLDVDASVEYRQIGKQELEGETVDLPPVVLARYPKQKMDGKKTLLVYAHYDVQPAALEDGWSSEPFKLTEDAQGRLYGRGSSDDKGPLLCWINIIKAHKMLNLELPVNLLMCFEGMEESGSQGLDDLIKKEKDLYFKDADYVCISDNYWLGTEKPCLTYGLRGVQYFMVEVHGPPSEDGSRKHGFDLHSGVFGGTVHEPMVDLVNVLSSLVKPDGTILVDGLMDQVAPLTEEEEKLYKSLDFSLDAFLQSTGTKSAITEQPAEILKRRWRYPTLSVHGIQNAFSGSGEKTVIPGNPIGKFSIRTVPNMQPDEVTKCVQAHVEKVFAKLNSKNVCKVYCSHAGKWWLSSPNHENYVAATRAIQKVYAPNDPNFKPDFTREGGSIPVTLTFEETLKKNVLLFPVGRCDDGAHSTNEKFDRGNYVFGMKALGTYLYELGKI
ncbi:hypothetical protein MIR68_008160 [Amoeboaphelidium protococcarum]|nr:hypothetical protein MIR68_008160 [Amoeboaphelidium protococcarum]